MGTPAARVGDPAAHGGTLAGPGVPTVLIGGMPAAALGDQHICPMAKPGSPPIPHVGGPVIRGSSGVFIGGRLAARLGDGAVCVGPPSAIVAGCPTVLIGETGAGSPLGSAAAAARAKIASPESVCALSALSCAAGKRSASASHAIEVALTDRAGRPLAGVPLLLRDTRGEAIPGMNNAEGRFTAPGQEAEGRFTVVVRRLHDARWLIDKAREAGVALKEVGELAVARQNDVVMPTDHPLVSLCDARHQRKTFDAMARPGNQFFRRHVLTRIHGSRWMFDSSQTQREAYLKGRRG